MAEERNTLDVLHELIETCRDGEDGYLHAAGLVSDPGLKSYFKEQNLERARFVQELRQEAVELGEKQPDTSGSIAGTLHRTWFAAKVDVGVGDQAILDSVEQGEDAAKKAYETALSSLLPENLRSLIRRQAQHVFSAHDYARELRDSKAA
jgi:uncharacterized protein (TIGR02284 family)